MQILLKTKNYENKNSSTKDFSKSENNINNGNNSHNKAFNNRKCY